MGPYLTIVRPDATSSTKLTSGGEHPNKRSTYYLIAFAFGALGAVGLLWSFTTALASRGRLPAPPLSGTWCIDHRLAWLKDHLEWREAAILAVGSSATMRNLNFEALPPQVRKQGVVNIAPCFLTVNQTRFMTEYILERSASAKSVMMVLAPRDLEGCSRNRTNFFDADIADRYLNDTGSDWWLYFRNLRINDIASHAIFARRRQSELSFDSFGSGPIEREKPDVGRPFKPEANCYGELTKLARHLQQKRVQFIVATLPVMPGWAERYDKQGAVINDFNLRVAQALSSTKAILVDGASEWQVEDAGFADPVHLQWPRTADFTKFVWQKAVERGGGPPLSPNSPETTKHWVQAEYKLEKGKEILVRSPLLDAISQNTPGQSEALGAGVPRGFSWCAGSVRTANRTGPPQDFTAVTGWGQVYPKLGSPPRESSEAAIEIANAQTFVHSRSEKRWLIVQDQARMRMAGSHFKADFSPASSSDLKIDNMPDSMIGISSPPPGYNAVFWPYDRGTFEANAVDGVYVRMDVRATDESMAYVANIGADWWRDVTAPLVEGYANNSGAGMSNWIELSTEWKTLHFFSWSASRVQSDPPPPLRMKSIAEIKRRPVQSSSYCTSSSTY